MLSFCQFKQMVEEKVLAGRTMSSARVLFCPISIFAYRDGRIRGAPLVLNFESIFRRPRNQHDGVYTLMKYMNEKYVKHHVWARRIGFRNLCGDRRKNEREVRKRPGDYERKVKVK